MSKLIAVEGCTITCKTPSVSVASFQIVTPPLNDFLSDGKKIYAGTLQVVATGITMGSFSCPSANFSIMPTQVAVSGTDMFFVVEGDGGICVCVGTSGNASTTINFRAEITNAGQSASYIAQGGALVNVTVPDDFKATLDALNENIAEVSETVSDQGNTIKDQQTQIDAVQDAISTISLRMHPVGSYYLSENATSPASLFGGTWEQIKDRFLVGAGNSYSVGATGGEATHTHATGGHVLSIDEMPKHSHKAYVTYYGGWGSGASALDKWRTDGTSPQNAWLPDVTVEETGGNASHSHGDTEASSNMPPYRAIYMWRRIS